MARLRGSCGGVPHGWVAIEETAEDRFGRQLSGSKVAGTQTIMPQCAPLRGRQEVEAKMARYESVCGYASLEGAEIRREGPAVGGLHADDLRRSGVREHLAALSRHENLPKARPWALEKTRSAASRVQAGCVADAREATNDDAREIAPVGENQACGAPAYLADQLAAGLTPRYQPQPHLISQEENVSGRRLPAAEIDDDILAERARPRAEDAERSSLDHEHLPRARRVEVMVTFDTAHGVELDLPVGPREFSRGSIG